MAHAPFAGYARVGSPTSITATTGCVSSGSQNSIFSMRSGASENDEYYYAQPGSKEQYKHAREESSSRKALTVATPQQTPLTISPPSLHPVTPMPMGGMGFGSMLYVPSSPGFAVIHHQLSAEDLAAMQSQAMQSAHTQVAVSYERKFQDMREEYQNHLDEKNIRLSAAKTAIESAKKEADTAKKQLAALQKKVDVDLRHLNQQMQADQQAAQELVEAVTRQRAQQPTITAMNNVTPTNQVVFKEPATNAYPFQQEVLALARVTTPEHRIIRPQPAASTYPGANHPTQYGNYNSAHHNSPEYVIQTHYAANNMGGNISNSGKEMYVTANPEDDVFDDHSPKYGPGLQYFFSNFGFEQPGLHDALSSCFSKVEHAVRLIPIVQMTGHAHTPAVRKIITMCQEHIEHRAEVYTMFGHPDEKYILITGVINSLLADHVFREGVITQFECVYQGAMNQTWDEEENCREVDIANVKMRSQLGKHRAEVANLVVQVNGFWQWVNDYTDTILDNLIPQIQAAFPKAYHTMLRQNLWRPVNEAIRIAARIRQDPRYFEYHFQRVGCTWDNRFMVARNPELAGQELSNVRSPYVTRCTVRPLIKVKDFDTQDGNGKVVYKSQVLISERKNTLRPYGRPGYYARRPHRR